MYDDILNKIVTVIVDRPLGCIHPKHKDIIYPVNYGYIEGIIAPDCEEQDAYILGISYPIKQFTGRIFAVIHRTDDVEDKWVVAPENVIINQAEIAEAVDFQEKYFKSSIHALYQKSCGVIVYRKSKERIEYLLLFQNQSKTWSFPKGHSEVYETELETAIREVKEEIGINVKLTLDFREEIVYNVSPLRQKQVILFLSEINDKFIKPNSEIEKYIWTEKTKACELLVHKKYDEILDKAENYIKGIKRYV